MKQVAQSGIDPVILSSLGLCSCIDLPSSAVLYEWAASHSAPHIVTERAEALSMGSLIGAATATRVVCPYAAVSDDRVQSLADAVECRIGSSRIHAHDVLSSQSSDLSGLISNLLIFKRIELRLESSGLIGDLVLQSHEGRVDLIVVGVRPLLDIIKACSGLS